MRTKTIGLMVPSGLAVPLLIAISTAVAAQTKTAAQDNDDPFTGFDAMISAEIPTDLASDLASDPESDGAKLRDDQSLLPAISALRWLKSDPNPAALLTRVPPVDVAPNRSALIELGRVAFRSPTLFGGYGAELNLSCEACHPAGRAQARFWLPPVADKPGRVDITNALFSHQAEDHQDNPRPISDLSASTPPFGTLKPIADLRTYISSVISADFSGPPADPLILDALTAYVLALSDTVQTKTLPIQVRHKYEAPDKILVRLHNDELIRSFVVLDKSLAEQHRATSAFVIDAIKASIGRFHGRLDPDDPARAAMVTAATSLDAIKTMIRQNKWASAAAQTRKINTALMKVTTPITSRADLTYYNKDWLAGALDPSLKIMLEPEADSEAGHADETIEAGDEPQGPSNDQ